ncbi:hypothetical protein BJ944DRAFT_273095, partial [Cunninghamella echinulata]
MQFYCEPLKSYYKLQLTGWYIQYRMQNIHLHHQNPHHQKGSKILLHKRPTYTCLQIRYSFFAVPVHIA